MTLGERILQKRKECGLSQESLGEKLDVTRQTVYKWESDQAIPELDKLITLAQIFGVRVGWLIAEEESDQKEQAYLEAAQRIAALLAQSQTPQPVGSEQVTDAIKAPTGQKISWFQGLVAAVLVVILVACVFNFASIDREIEGLKKTNQSALSASSHEENPTVPTMVFSGPAPGQKTQSITTETELTVYSAPSATTRSKGILAPGETVEIRKTEHVGTHLWGYVQHQSTDGKELIGWVNLDNMELNLAAEEATEASQSEQNTQVITTETELTVYAFPSDVADSKGTLAPGETVEILRTVSFVEARWCYIQHQLSDGTELTGWVNLDNMELNPAAEEATEASQLEQDTQSITAETELTIYSAPSTTARQVGAVVPGESVEIRKTEHVETHLWGYIQYQQANNTELTGWINLDTIEPETKPESTK